MFTRELLRIHLHRLFVRYLGQIQFRIKSTHTFIQFMVLNDHLVKGFRDRKTVSVLDFISGVKHFH